MKIRNITQRTFQAGFTMIELLIVIAILGILAVAVLAAINPVEQINRGRDTGSRSDAEQLLSASDRFYAFQGFYPWRRGNTDVESDGSTPLAWTKVTATAPVDKGGTCLVLEKLSSEPTSTTCSSWADELKLSFVERITDATNYNSLFMYNRGYQGDSTYVCFAPKSKAFATEVMKKDLDNNGDIEATEVPDDYPFAKAVANVDGECGPEGNCVCLP